MGALKTTAATVQCCMPKIKLDMNTKNGDAHNKRKRCAIDGDKNTTAPNNNNNERKIKTERLRSTETARMMPTNTFDRLELRASQTNLSKVNDDFVIKAILKRLSVQS